MGLFPFGCTVGSMSNSSTEPTNAYGMGLTRDVWHSAWCWRPNWPGGTYHNTRPSLSSVVSIVPSRPPTSTSCSGTARHSVGAVDLGCIHGTHGERRPTLERGPP
jgi:hypothetical protein